MASKKEIKEEKEGRFVKIKLNNRVNLPNDSIKHYEANLEVNGFSDIEAVESSLQATMILAKRVVDSHKEGCTCEPSRFCKQIIESAEKLYREFTPKTGN